MYYLQTRYYDSTTARFINADGYVNANGDMLGFNMFAYCGNNPVMGVDPTGEWTFSWGITINFGIFGGGYSFYIGISFDSHGDVALQASRALPNEKDPKTGKTAEKNMVFGINISGGVTAQWTKYDSVNDLVTKNVTNVGVNAQYIGADILLEKGRDPVGVALGTGIGYSADVHITKFKTVNIIKPFRSLSHYIKDKWG